MYTVHTRALERAAQLLGGEQALAHYLKVSEELLRRLMNGTADLPERLFLKLVDVLLDPDFAELQQSISRAAHCKTREDDDSSHKKA